MEFAKMHIAFGQIMHCLKLVWHHSESYKTPRRMVVLLREIVNIFIDSISAFLEPRSLFLLEPLEAQPKVEAALDLIAFIEAEFVRTKAAIIVAKDEPWSFESDLVLGRLRAYNVRLLELRQVVNIRCDYEKLEKVELSDPVQAGDVTTDTNCRRHRRRTLCLLVGGVACVRRMLGQVNQRQMLL
jgi:dynein heavy chain